MRCVHFALKHHLVRVDQVPLTVSFLDDRKREKYKGEGERKREERHGERQSKLGTVGWPNCRPQRAEKLCTKYRK